MGLDLTLLLDLPVYRAVDVDADGNVLVATDESGSMQLVEVAADGRRTTLTALSGPCSGRYLPGERAVLVMHDAGGNERTQISVLRLGGASGPAGLDDLEPFIRDPRHIHNIADLAAGRLSYVTNRRNGVDFDVIVRDLATGAETVGYAGGGNVGSVAVSDDGRRLALTVPGTPPLSDQILVVDLATGGTTALTGADEYAENGRLCFTPDGDALIVTSSRDRDMTGIARYDLAGGGWRWLVTDDHADLSAWLSPDGRHLLVEANVDGASQLALHDAASGRPVRPVELPAPGCVVAVPLPAPRWSADSRTVVLSFSGVNVPGDVLSLDAASGAVTTLIDSAGHLDRLDEPRSVRIPTPDGESVPCFVYPAVDAAAGPSVINIHGGPEGQSKRIFSPIIAGLRLAGFTVLVPNVRGSVGYGKRWAALDDVRLRLDSVADLAAIHDHLPALDLDPSRSALWGGSYGGYMVLAGLAFQPGRWAAGVDIVGMSSLVTFLENTSAYRRSIREREYGRLSHDRDFLELASPLTKVDQMRAPLFVIHGANDPRVPVTEAEQLHTALTGNGVECELLVFADEGHGLAKRVNKLMAYPRALDFLRRHLAAEIGAPAAEATG